MSSIRLESVSGGSGRVSYSLNGKQLALNMKPLEGMAHEQRSRASLPFPEGTRISCTKAVGIPPGDIYTMDHLREIMQVAYKITQPMEFQIVEANKRIGVGTSDQTIVVLLRMLFQKHPNDSYIIRGPRYKNPIDCVWFIQTGDERGEKAVFQHTIPERKKRKNRPLVAMLYTLKPLTLFEERGHPPTGPGSHGGRSGPDGDTTIPPVP